MTGGCHNMTFAVVPTAARTSRGRRTLAVVSPRSRARYSCPKEEASGGVSNCSCVCTPSCLYTVLCGVYTSHGAQQ